MAKSSFRIRVSSMHRLIDIKGVTRMSNCFVLSSGPSQEILFDSLRLGGKVSKLGVVDFWACQCREADSLGIIIHVEIQGLHRHSDNKWFFWGREKAVVLNNNGSQQPPSLTHAKGYVFGTWDTQHRRGTVTLKLPTPFSPPVEEQDVFDEAMRKK